MAIWRSPGVWEAVATELRGYRHGGLAGLLTEDVVRFAAIRSLVHAGVVASSLRLECPHPALTGARVDLVVGSPHVSAAIEFKYPREPNEKNAAWTMVLGEVLKDFYRLASYPGDVDRLFVYAETAALHRYMTGAAARFGLEIDTDQVVLRPAGASRLPATAAQILGGELASHHVTAERIAHISVDTGLRVAVYVVDPLGAAPSHAAQAAVTGSNPALQLAAHVLAEDAAPPQIPSRLRVQPARAAALEAEASAGARAEILHRDKRRPPASRQRHLHSRRHPD